MATSGHTSSTDIFLPPISRYNTFMMNRGEDSNYIPTDLIIEIFTRLPAKSINRFRCLSKLWDSILCRQDFTELFLTRSSTRPRLLFSVEGEGEWFFYSSPQSQNQSLVVTADFHMKFRGDPSHNFCSYASGMIYLPHMLRNPTENVDAVRPVHVICNPVTGHYANLRKLRKDTNSYSYIGFDPIDKKFKVLSMAYPGSRVDDNILTLRTRKMTWRKIQRPFTYDHYEPLNKSICINGVLYYLAQHSVRLWYKDVIVCFDVRSEKFNVIDAKGRYNTLVNYKGKLCEIDVKYSNKYGRFFPLELHMWVLEDVEKQEWSNYVYTLMDENIDVNFDDDYDLFVVGMTASGEIVLAKEVACKPFYVFYFNPEKNSLQRVEIQNLEEAFKIEYCRFGRSVYIFVDYVVDLSFNDAMPLKSRRVKKDQNIVKEMPKPQHRRDTSNDLCNSASSVKNKQPILLLQNKYELLANLFYWPGYFYLIFYLFSSIILLA